MRRFSALSVVCCLMLGPSTGAMALTPTEQAQQARQAQFRQEQQRAQAQAQQEKRRQQSEALQEQRKEKLEAQQEQRRLKLEAQQEQQQQRAEALQEQQQQRLQEVRAQQARRVPSLAAATGAAAAGQGACDGKGGFGGYAEKLAAKVKPLIDRPATAGNVLAVLELRSKADGAITEVKLRVPSGNKEWDDAALHGLQKLGSLPRHVDGRLPASLVVGVSPSWFFVDAIRPQ